jgi:hypothetical protein
LLFSVSRRARRLKVGAFLALITYDVYGAALIVRMQSLSRDFATHNNKFVKMGIYGEKSRKKSARKR